MVLLGGADGSFEMSDVGGIELCPNVTSISATSMLARRDTRKPTPLARLTHLSISPAFDNLETLLDLKALKQLPLLDHGTYTDVITPGHPTRALFEAMKAGGVMVWVGLTSRKDDCPSPFE